MFYVYAALAAASMYISACVAAFVTNVRMNAVEKLLAGALGFAAAYGYFHLLLRLEMGMAGMFAANTAGTLTVVSFLVWLVKRKKRRKQNGSEHNGTGNDDQPEQD